MNYYVISSLTKDSEPKRLVSFDTYDHACRYSDALIKENPTHFYIGVVGYDEWFNCFA